MLKRCIVLAIVMFAWGGSIEAASAQHERWYEFNGTHFSFSLERFMGVDYTKFEGRSGHASARFLLNASEPVPTSFARAGFDVFLHRFSIGVAGGFTSDDVGVIAPRIGYLFGLTPVIGLWLRGGAFYAATPGPDYFGMTAEALLGWFPYPILAFHLGPTMDLAFANGSNAKYFSLGIPQFGMTAFF